MWEFRVFFYFSHFHGFSKNSILASDFRSPVNGSSFICCSLIGWRKKRRWQWVISSTHCCHPRKMSMIRKTTVFKKRKFIRNFLLINNHFKRFILKYFINLIHFNNLIWRENCIFRKNRWFPGISGTPEVPKYRRCTAPIDYLRPPKKFGSISYLWEEELQN